MTRKKAILLNEPHLETVQEGNTTDCATIAHFRSDMPLKAKDIIVSLPYNSEGYTEIKVTACGVNLLQCDTFTTGTSKNITYTGYRNAQNEITYITAKGKANNSNCFRNLNYASGLSKWPPNGKYCTYAYSDDVNITFVGLTVTPTDTEGYDYAPPTGRWRTYNLSHNSSNGAEWLRIQMAPNNCKDIDFDTTIYPLVCLAQDQGCEFEPYNGQTYTITFSTTIYGGIVHLMTGEITNGYLANGDSLSGSVSNAFTPISVRVKKGINNIWSDFGAVTVKYWNL